MKALAEEGRCRVVPRFVTNKLQNRMLLFNIELL